MSLRVVKLGGSLLGDDALLIRLRGALLAGAGRVVVVPGGGPFADAVRASQTRWGFSDRNAHRMALLAMRQLGLMLCALEPALREAEGVRGVRRALDAPGSRVPVWLPEEGELDAAGVAASWDVSSDSLAAHLADLLGATELVLVKSCPLPRDASPEALTRAGLVDPAFPAYFARARCALLWDGPDGTTPVTGAAASARDLPAAP